MKVGKLIKFFGWVLIAVAGAVVFVSYMMILIKEGFWAVTELLNPLNILNFMATVAAFLPGFALLKLGDWLMNKRVQTNDSE